MKDSLKTKHYLCILAVKWLPMIAFFGLECHVMTLLTGKPSTLPEINFGTSVYTYIVLLAASYGLGFCVMHRLLITHAFLVTMCIYYQRLEGFGEILIHARWAVFIFGLILLVQLIRKKGIKMMDDDSCSDCKNCPGNNL